jgi:ATP-dependent RNA helicase DDX24/MAK5
MPKHTSKRNKKINNKPISSNDDDDDGNSENLDDFDVSTIQQTNTPSTSSKNGWETVTDVWTDAEMGMLSLETCDNYKIENGQLIVLPLSSSSSTTTKKTKTNKKRKADLIAPPPVDDESQPQSNNSFIIPLPTDTKKKKKQKLSGNPKPIIPSSQPPPPLLPTSEWDEFHLYPSLTSSLVLELKYLSPTPIQRLCLPPGIDNGKDILGMSETGSGKTLAFGLIILHGLLTNPPHPDSGLAALIITPTRELAMQITQHLRQVLVNEPLNSRPRVEPIVGGISEDKQERLLSKKPAVVVATLGRLANLMESGHVHFKDLNKSLRYLVLDEADRMCDKAHVKDLEPIVELLEQGTKRRQTMLFSATLENGAVETLMNRLGKRGKPQWCSTTLATTTLPTTKNNHPTIPSTSTTTTNPTNILPSSLHLIRMDCLDEEKDINLYYFLREQSTTSGISCLVFVNTVNTARRIHGILSLVLENNNKTLVTTLHANMEQKQRLRHLDKFKDTNTYDLRILIATDVAARGLDIPQVDYVIHYGIPHSSEIFIHRSGRTARAGRKGTVISLVGGSDEINFARITKNLLGNNSTTLDDDDNDGTTHQPIIHEKYGIQSKQFQICSKIIKLATKIHLMESQITNAKMDKQWKSRAAEEMEIIVSDDENDYGTGIIDSDEDEETDFKHGSGLQTVLNKAHAKNQHDRNEKELTRLRLELNNTLLEEQDRQVKRGKFTLPRSSNSTTPALAHIPAIHEKRRKQSLSGSSRTKTGRHNQKKLNKWKR